MPPSPTVTARLDPHKYVELCEAMGIEYAPVAGFVTRRKQAGGTRLYGTYDPMANSIQLYLNLAEQGAEGLRMLAGDLTRTLLHELRHRWQHEQHGAGWYERNVVAAENDANNYARLHCQEWRGVVKVGRKHHGSGFSKLSTTQRKVTA
jgi:hypothetical protein